MRYRDARGRFRKPTDEERWPDPNERAHRQFVRDLLTTPPWLLREYASLITDAVMVMHGTHKRPAR